MSGNEKVVWREGMFLQPQHFQQAERHIFGSVNSRFSLFFPHGYGFSDFAVDAETIAGGNFRLTRCSGVMPDGTVFDLPARSPLPGTRAIGDLFSHEHNHLNVHLALPSVAEGKNNVISQSGIEYIPARYTGGSFQVTDEVDGTRKKDIEAAALNFTLLFSGEPRDTYSSMRIARLVRSGSGEISLDETFIPPLLSIGASTRVMSEIRSLLEILLAKSHSLSEGRKHLSGGLAGFGSNDDFSSRLLQVINTFTPLLNHFHFMPVVHPWNLFEHLTMLSGALCSFSSEVSIRQLPRYEHAGLSNVLRRFSEIIKSVVCADAAQACRNIPVEKSGQSTYVGVVSDRRLLDTARFFLSVSAAVPEKELVVGCLQRIKMCSRERLDLLIPSAMPGLPLVNVSRPPEALSTRPGHIYFSLDKDGEFWKEIKDSGTIAFYFPNNYPELQIELLALNE